ncbi:MAG: PhzF family phenazine biosynthesis protein [Gemmatimonadota bacterium]|nr:PhzF family phenazine biosynthesis protein [Gemmatimonadota bacterium]MDH4349244.1 PhzF family phenazine biosynthesis protein [Gemmatimonadota bacterium]MDH5282851.1 PhzF family phenazine biosynthesis protein [Gemmatimonadota bacterium]
MHTIVVVDAFTDQRFRGNPAAVCVLPGPADETWMRDVAREMNLSETAFLHRVADGFALRWFTPTVEVDLCGHATLASAHVLWQDGHLDPGEAARFHTLSGLLTASRTNTEILLDFPATPAIESPRPAGLADALGLLRYRWVGETRFDLLVELDSEDTVRALEPDMSALGRIECRGVIVTAAADGGRPYDFVSRFFAPAAGVPEDPVTGSAHCALGPYWRRRIARDRLVGYQASARGGTVSVTCRGDRVVLGGAAVTSHRTLLL